jgi:anti-sigma factor RsiW
VPDLQAAGLGFVQATRCNFGQRVVNMMVYTGAAGGRFSLYMSDGDTREFKLLRTRAVNGVPQLRHSVRIDDEAHHVHDDFEVAIWQRGNLVYTWVGPVANPAYEAALAALQQSR